MCKTHGKEALDMVLFPLWGQRSYCFPNRFISSIPLEFHTPFALHGWPRNRNVFHSTFLFVFFRPRSANASSRGVEGHRHTTQRSIHTEAGTVRSDTPLTWGWTHICETAIYIYMNLLGSSPCHVSSGNNRLL